MDGIERVIFDFSGDGGFDNLKTLEDILCSGHWSGRALNYEDERTILLLRLLHAGGIAVCKRGYVHAADSPDIRRRADELNEQIRKRHISKPLLDVARIFFEHEYDARKTEYNSPFFPALKAFVRCGGLPPDRLLGLLERDDCERVFLFPDYLIDDEDAFFEFVLEMPKEMYLDELRKTEERIWAAVHEAMRRVNEKSDIIIPPPVELSDSE